MSNITNAEINKINEMNYDEFINYYINKKSNGQPKVKYGATGYSKKGYECHHIKEYEVSNLSAKENRSEADYLSMQLPEELVYLTNEQHLAAHMKISAEALLRDSNADKAELQSLGGIGLIYTYHKDTMDKNAVGRLFANYCSKITVQMIFDTNSSEECLEVVAKRFGLTEVHYNIAKSYLRPTVCLEHNRQAYVDAERVLYTKPSVIACICTCGGKTPFAIEWMEQYKVSGKKFLVVVPNKNINHGWACDDDGNPKNTELYDVKIINTLSNEFKRDDIDWDKYCGVVFDEVHHVHEDAKIWRQPILDAKNRGIKVLGLTATVKDSQTMESDDIFEGRIVYGLDIAEGIRNETLWSYKYITSLFTFDSKFAGLEDSEYNILSDKLDLFRDVHHITQLIRDFEVNRTIAQRKGIIFVGGTRNIPESQRVDKLAVFNRAIDLVKEAYPNADFYILSSHQSDEENYKNRFNFIQEKNKDVFLVSFGMVNEGAHYEGVNTLIMFRNTKSEALFIQQLGRIMRLRSKCPVDPQLAVFDFTNNALSLAASNDEEFDFSDKPASGKTTAARPQTYLEGKDIVMSAELKDIISLIDAIRVNKDNRRESKLLSEIDFQDLLGIATIEDAFSDLTEAAEWAGIDIEDTEATNIGTTCGCANNETTTTTSSASGSSKEKSAKSKKTSAVKKMSKEEALIYVTKLVFDRLVITEGVFRGKIIDADLVEFFCKMSKLKTDVFAKIITTSKLVKFWEVRAYNLAQTLQ